MINVCFQCGIYRADKIIDPSGPYAICPECGYKHPFLQLPLLIVSGASCSGKTTVCRELISQIGNAVMLDSDILWRPEFNTPETKYREFFEIWLRMCKNISQSRRPVILFGAGFGVPENIEGCIERRYFSQIHYLALVCSDQVLVERLKQRPDWRGSGNEEFVKAQLQFNTWFKKYNAQPNIKLIDTSELSIKEVISQVKNWADLIIV